MSTPFHERAPNVYVFEGFSQDLGSLRCYRRRLPILYCQVRDRMRLTRLTEGLAPVLPLRPTGNWFQTNLKTRRLCLDHLIKERRYELLTVECTN